MFFIVCLSHIIWWLFERNALVKFRNLSISKLFDYDGYLLQVQHLITGSILLWITRTAFMYWDCGNSVNSWLFWFKAFTPLLSILNYYYRRWKRINRPMTFIDVFTKWYLQIIVRFTKKNDMINNFIILLKLINPTNSNNLIVLNFCSHLSLYFLIGAVAPI
jgi:hypothetical protein